MWQNSINDRKFYHSIRGNLRKTLEDVEEGETMAVEIYFAIVRRQQTRQNNRSYLETPYVGTANPGSIAPPLRTPVPLLNNQPAMTGNIIYHLVYREGKTIATAEPLVMPSDQHSHTGINDNPHDPVHFTGFYIGITFNFWQRACEHAQARFGERMYVIYRTRREPQATSNLERRQIQPYLRGQTIQSMHQRSLTNYNTLGGDPQEHEFLYVLFR